MLPQHTIAAVLVASLCAGCAVGPDYVRPEVALPSTYQALASPDRNSAGVPAGLSAWWTGFGDEQLNQYVAQALEQNLDLAQSVARVAQARAGLGAADAALMPSGAVSGQAARAYQSVETPLGQVLSARPGFDRFGNMAEINAGASWEMDLFGALRRGKEASLAEYQASEAGVVGARLAVAAQTADTYILIRGLQTRLEIAQQQVNTQQELLVKTRLLHHQGLVPATRLHQVESGVAQARAAVPVLEATMAVALNAMDVMLGLPPGAHRADFSSVGAIPVPPAMVDAGAPGQLLRRRPDLIIAERRLAASSARIGEAMAEYYPKLSLSGMLGSSTSVSTGNLFSGGASQAAGVLGLRWRLFDFGRINAQIAQAKGREAEMLSAYRLAALRATEEVENALTAWVKREEQTVALRQNMDAVSQARAASVAAYEKGVVARIDVLQVDGELWRASDARAQAQIDTARAAVASFKALGGGGYSSDAGS